MSKAQIQMLGKEKSLSATSLAHAPWHFAENNNFHINNEELQAMKIITNTWDSI